ncbi:MAG: thymidylate kinase [Candidatus Curtissbacteria bacterium]|nr:thymidylate kinase [Candidatus Curtissbacteria bacterium]
MARKSKLGKLIVFEGPDGSGKTTQAKLLLAYLRNPPAGGKIPNVYISFPRYEKPWGKMVRRYLAGDFGKIGEVDPYFASMFYAHDRADAAPMISGWIREGKIVVCNRYVGSNIGHMGAKFKTQNEKLKYIKWLEDLEYRENKIPKEDLVVLLQVDPKVSRKLMEDRKLDIHEKDLAYQEEVWRVYNYVAGLKKNWVRVDCTKGGKLLSADQIHEKVLAVLGKRGIL